MESVSEFRIVLPKKVYCPGERIDGQLVLSTTAPILAKALRIRLEQRASVHWHIGGGDNRVDYHGTRVYAYEKHTVWGPVHTTSLLDGAGEHACWGTPWSPNEGVLDIPLSAASGSKIGIKVMDYDPGKRDDLCGETVIDVDALLAYNGRAVTLPLFRRQGMFGKGAYEAQNGKTGRPSVVAVSATLSHLPLTTLFQGNHGGWQQGGVRRVRIQVHGAMNLRSADLLSKNDIYCQLFELPPTAQAGQEPLPDMSGAAGNASMPVARQLVVPFSFQLPWHMPSSVEAMVPGTDYTYVRCSIYANLDISWRMDPSTRCLITIVQTLPASLPRLLEPAVFENGPTKPVFGMNALARACPACMACLCCCCDCCMAESPLADTSNKLGDVHVMCRLDRAGLVPGSTVGLSLRVSNSSPAAMVVRIAFVRRYRCNSHSFGMPGRTVTGETQQIEVASMRLPGNTVSSLSSYPMLVPLMSPDYHGQPSFDPSAAAAAWGGDYNLGQRWKAMLPEPLLWWTVMRVTVDVAPNEPATFRKYICELGVVMCAPVPTAGPGAVVVGVPQQHHGMVAAHQPWVPLQGVQDDGSPPGDDPCVQPPFVCTADLPKVDPAGMSSFGVAPTAAINAMDYQEDTHCCNKAELMYAPTYLYQAVSPGGGAGAESGRPPPGAAAAAGGVDLVPHPMMLLADSKAAGWKIEPAGEKR